MKYIIDAHQDLAWNMHIFGRDYTRSVLETRQLEAGTLTPKLVGDSLLGWQEFQSGSIAVVFGTLFALPLRKSFALDASFCYEDENQAYKLYSAQLDVYSRLVEEYPDKFALVSTRLQLEHALSDLESREASTSDGKNIPVGIVLAMEGAEGIRNPSELEEWWGRGVRSIGPAWIGNRYCGGTGEPGPLTPLGYELLETMAEFGFILDLSHMDELAAIQALDTYPGLIIASHSNVRALLKGDDSNRHLPDQVIRRLIERDGVIGLVPFNEFLVNGWKAGDDRQVVNLNHYTAHIDYICQMAGDTTHAAIGSDFDGGFGLQSVPKEIDSIADLNKIGPLLQEKGYSEGDLENIMYRNWFECLSKTLPEE